MKKLFATLLRGDGMKEKNFQKYPKWIKGKGWFKRVMEVFANHKAQNEGEQKRMNRDDASKFQVGDRVYAPFHGYGTVIKVHEHPSVYPVVVKWDNSATSLVEEVNLFTEDGYLSRWTKTDYIRISIAREPLKEGETMKDNKIKTDAINPPHYRVKGIPEAYDIMTHLMNKEQLEGFLWGNIIKYAYRYGRKGDEAGTAGKIKWYAQKLKELGECESK